MDSDNFTPARAGGPLDPNHYGRFVPGQEDEDIQDRVTYMERVEALYDALDLLPDQQGKYIQLSMLGATQKDIAAICGVSESAVSHGLARARKALAEQLAYLY
jgi:RNA polymerase sigma factor (sigma-70 family)